MTVADALMLALGVIAVGSGALVVTSAHLVRAGLYLVISLGAVAGLYLVLGAELVAWVQVLVYVGAVVVLLLFAVMLTRAPIGPSRDLDRPAAPAALIGAGVGFGLAALLADGFHWNRYDLPPPGTAERIGGQVFGGWVLPFEVLSILLLAALVGAIVLSRPDLGARPDPAAAAGPAGVPVPDPIAESDEVVARLERIAARQAAAQSRLRQEAAEQRAAGAEPVEPSPAPPSPQDVLKSQASDVVFGAHARRARVGGDTPPEPGTTRDGVIEGTATESRPPRPGRAIGGRATGRPAIEGSATERPAIEKSATERPAIEGSATGRPAIEKSATERPAIEGSATERPALGNGERPRRGRPGRGDRPALPSAEDQPGEDA